MFLIQQEYQILQINVKATLNIILASTLPRSRASCKASSKWVPMVVITARVLMSALVASLDLQLGLKGPYIYFTWVPKKDLGGLRAHPGLLLNVLP